MTSMLLFKMIASRLCLYLCLGVLLQMPLLPVIAQIPPADESLNATPIDTASDAPPTTEQLETTGQTVKIDGGASDADIATRLVQILTASQRYENLEVQARDGIVFIDGTTTRNDHKQWASQLAQRTEDVVAVVNRLEVLGPVNLDQYNLRDQLIDIWRGLLRALPLLALGLLILTVSAGLARLVTAILGWPLGHFVESRLLRNVIRKVIGLMVIVGGLVLFLRVADLTDVALAVVSGTGLIGLVLGFAFRDIAENFLASILLSVQTPFRLGDVIEVEGYTGVVQTVTPRGTVLVDFDGNHIQLANATVYKATLKNLTANPYMRMNFDVGIGYDASVKQAQATAFDTLQQHPAVLADPEPMVLVDTLGASTINLKIYFWIDGTIVSGLKVKSALMRRVVRAIEQQGISLPDESREIIFPDGVPLVPPAATAAVDDEGSATADSASNSSPATHDATDADDSTPREPTVDSASPDTPADPNPREAAPNPEAQAARKQARVIQRDLADHATDAEGDLSSEVAQIQEQADRSRNPEAGPGIID